MTLDEYFYIIIFYTILFDKTNQAKSLLWQEKWDKEGATCQQTSIPNKQDFLMDSIVQYIYKCNPRRRVNICIVLGI
jgi:hypothetical protein